jgi:integrase
MKSASPSRRDRLRAQLADLKMPGALEALDAVLASVDAGQGTVADAIEAQRRTAIGRPVWGGRRIRTRIFRQTYCAARLQTLDRGQPVSLYTVSRELGHDSEDMVRRVYARLGKVRHRVEAVEFRPEQWFDEIDGQLVPREGRKRAIIQAGRD